MVSALAIEKGPGPQVGASYCSGLAGNRSDAMFETLLEHHRLDAWWARLAVPRSRVRVGCRGPEFFEAELVLDFAAVALPGAKPVVSQQPPRGAVFPPRGGDEAGQAVGMRALDRELGECVADAHPLERIGDFDRYFGYSRSLCVAHVSTDADD